MITTSPVSLNKIILQVSLLYILYATCYLTMQAKKIKTQNPPRNAAQSKLQPQRRAASASTFAFMVPATSVCIHVGIAQTIDPPRACHVQLTLSCTVRLRKQKHAN